MVVWGFGGIGMLLLTKHLRCQAYGGVVAALGFVASGFYTGHAEHMSSIYSVSFRCGVPMPQANIATTRVSAGTRRPRTGTAMTAMLLIGVELRSVKE
jgi:hypothetical protein